MPAAPLFTDDNESKWLDINADAFPLVGKEIKVYKAVALRPVPRFAF
jgi:hypothetical protein